MPDYFKMDDRWEPYGITSKEEYEKHVVIKGYFHEGVPGDVIREFLTVEYLMAHAFYYWLFWDEAFAKCLFIFEMAVKLKAKVLGIETEIRKNGKHRNRRLVDLIDDICVGEHYDMLKTYLHRARELRNTVAHPNRHGFSGPHGLNRNIRHFVVTLNRLFREETWFIKQRTLREKIRKEIKRWGDQPIVVEAQQTGALFSSVQTIEVYEEHLMVSLIPVLNVEKLSNKKEQPFPVSYFIKNVGVEKGRISGKSNDGIKLSLFPINEDRAMKAVENSNKYLEQFSEEELELGRTMNANIAAWKLVDIEYEYLRSLYPRIREE